MTKVICFRLDEESEPGKIFEKWRDKGYEPRFILENALLAMEGVEPPILHQMNGRVIDELNAVVARLDKAVSRLSRGATSDGPREHSAKQDETHLDEPFIEGMKRTVKPPIQGKKK